MHTELVHYLAALRLLQQARWGIGAAIVSVGAALSRSGIKMLPELHPTRTYYEGRIEKNRAMRESPSVGLAPWAKLLGQGAVIVTLSVLLLLTTIGSARTTHHAAHFKSEHVGDLWRK